MAVGNGSRLGNFQHLYGDELDDDDDDGDNNFIIALEDNGEEDDSFFSPDTRASDCSPSVTQISPGYGSQAAPVSVHAPNRHDHDPNAVDSDCVLLEEALKRLVGDSSPEKEILTFPSSIFEKNSNPVPTYNQDSYPSPSGSISQPAPQSMWTTVPQRDPPSYQNSVASIANMQKTSSKYVSYLPTPVSVMSSTIRDIFSDKPVTSTDSSKGFETIPLTEETGGMWSEAIFLSDIDGVYDKSITYSSAGSAAPVDNFLGENPLPTSYNHTVQPTSTHTMHHEEPVPVPPILAPPVAMHVPRLSGPFPKGHHSPVKAPPPTLTTSDKAKNAITELIEVRKVIKEGKKVIGPHKNCTCIMCTPLVSKNPVYSDQDGPFLTPHETRTIKKNCAQPSRETKKAIARTPQPTTHAIVPPSQHYINNNVNQTSQNTNAGTHRNLPALTPSRDLFELLSKSKTGHVQNRDIHKPTPPSLLHKSAHLTLPVRTEIPVTAPQINPIQQTRAEIPVVPQKTVRSVSQTKTKICVKPQDVNLDTQARTEIPVTAPKLIHQILQTRTEDQVAPQDIRHVTQARTEVPVTSTHVAYSQASATYVQLSQANSSGSNFVVLLSDLTDKTRHQAQQPSLTTSTQVSPSKTTPLILQGSTRPTRIGSLMLNKTAVTSSSVYTTPMIHHPASSLIQTSATQPVQRHVVVNKSTLPANVAQVISKVQSHQEPVTITPNSMYSFVPGSSAGISSKVNVPKLVPSSPLHTSHVMLQQARSKLGQHLGYSNNQPKVVDPDPPGNIIDKNSAYQIVIEQGSNNVFLRRVPSSESNNMKITAPKPPVDKTSQAKQTAKKVSQEPLMVDGNSQALNSVLNNAELIDLTSPDTVKIKVSNAKKVAINLNTLVSRSPPVNQGTMPLKFTSASSMSKAKAAPKNKTPPKSPIKKSDKSPTVTGSTLLKLIDTHFEDQQLTSSEAAFLRLIKSACKDPKLLDATCKIAQQVQQFAESASKTQDSQNDSAAGPSSAKDTVLNGHDRSDSCPTGLFFGKSAHKPTFQATKLSNQSPYDKHTQASTAVNDHFKRSFSSKIHQSSGYHTANERPNTGHTLSALSDQSNPLQSYQLPQEGLPSSYVQDWVNQTSQPPHGWKELGSSLPEADDQQNEVLDLTMGKAKRKQKPVNRILKEVKKRRRKQHLVKISDQDLITINYKNMPPVDPAINPALSSNHITSPSVPVSFKQSAEGHPPVPSTGVSTVSVLPKVSSVMPSTSQQFQFSGETNKSKHSSSVVACSKSKGIKLKIRLNEKIKRRKAFKKKQSEGFKKVHIFPPCKPNESDNGLLSNDGAPKELNDSSCTSGVAVPQPKADSDTSPQKDASKAETTEEMFQRFQEEAQKEVYNAQFGVGYLSRSLRPARSTIAFLDKMPRDTGAPQAKKKAEGLPDVTEAKPVNLEEETKQSSPVKSLSQKLLEKKDKSAVLMKKKRPSVLEESQSLKSKQPKLSLSSCPRLKEDTSLPTTKTVYCANILAGHKVYVRFNTFENDESGRCFLVPFFNLGGTRKHFDVEDAQYIDKAVSECEKEERNCARHLMYFCREGKKASFLRKESSLKSNQLSGNYTKKSFLLEGFKVEAPKLDQVAAERQWAIDKEVDIEIDTADLDNDMDIDFTGNPLMVEGENSNSSENTATKINESSVGPLDDLSNNQRKIHIASKMKPADILLNKLGGSLDKEVLQSDTDKDSEHHKENENDSINVTNGKASDPISYTAKLQDLILSNRGMADKENTDCGDSDMNPFLVEIKKEKPDYVEYDPEPVHQVSFTTETCAEHSEKTLGANLKIKDEPPDDFIYSDLHDLPVRDKIQEGSLSKSLMGSCAGTNASTSNSCKESAASVSETEKDSLKQQKSGQISSDNSIYEKLASPVKSTKQSGEIDLMEKLASKSACDKDHENVKNSLALATEDNRSAVKVTPEIEKSNVKRSLGTCAESFIFNKGSEDIGASVAPVTTNTEAPADNVVDDDETLTCSSHESPPVSSSVSESSDMSSPADLRDLEEDYLSATGTTIKANSAAPQKITSLVESLRQRLTHQTTAVPSWVASSAPPIVHSKIKKRAKKDSKVNKKSSKRLKSSESSARTDLENDSVSQTVVGSNAVPSSSQGIVSATTSFTDMNSPTESSKTDSITLQLPPLSDSVPSTSNSKQESGQNKSSVAKKITDSKENKLNKKQSVPALGFGNGFPSTTYQGTSSDAIGDQSVCPEVLSEKSDINAKSKPDVAEHSFRVEKPRMLSLEVKQERTDVEENEANRTSSNLIVDNSKSTESETAVDSSNNQVPPQSTRSTPSEIEVGCDDLPEAALGFCPIVPEGCGIAPSQRNDDSDDWSSSESGSLSPVAAVVDSLHRESQEVQRKKINAATVKQTALTKLVTKPHNTSIIEESQGSVASYLAQKYAQISGSESNPGVWHTIKGPRLRKVASSQSAFTKPEPYVKGHSAASPAAGASVGTQILSAKPSLSEIFGIPVQQNKEPLKETKTEATDAADKIRLKLEVYPTQKQVARKKTAKSFVRKKKVQPSLDEAKQSTCNLELPTDHTPAAPQQPTDHSLIASQQPNSQLAADDNLGTLKLSSIQSKTDDRRPESAQPSSESDPQQDKTDAVSQPPTSDLQQDNKEAATQKPTSDLQQDNKKAATKKPSSDLQQYKSEAASQQATPDLPNKHKTRSITKTEPPTIQPTKSKSQTSSGKKSNLSTPEPRLTWRQLSKLSEKEKERELEREAIEREKETELSENFERESVISLKSDTSSKTMQLQPQLPPCEVLLSRLEDTDYSLEFEQVDSFSYRLVRKDDASIIHFKAEVEDAQDEDKCSMSVPSAGQAKKSKRKKKKTMTVKSKKGCAKPKNKKDIVDHFASMLESLRKKAMQLEEEEARKKQEEDANSKLIVINKFDVDETSKEVPTEEYVQEYAADFETKVEKDGGEEIDNTCVDNQVQTECKEKSGSTEEEQLVCRDGKNKSSNAVEAGDLLSNSLQHQGPNNANVEEVSKMADSEFEKSVDTPDKCVSGTDDVIMAFVKNKDNNAKDTDSLNHESNNENTDPARHQENEPINEDKVTRRSWETCGAQEKALHVISSSQKTEVEAGITAGYSSVKASQERSSDDGNGIQELDKSKPGLNVKETLTQQKDTEHNDREKTQASREADNDDKAQDKSNTDLCEVEEHRMETLTEGSNIEEERPLLKPDQSAVETNTTSSNSFVETIINKQSPNDVRNIEAATYDREEAVVMKDNKSITEKDVSAEVDKGDNITNKETCDVTEDNSEEDDCFSFGWGDDDEPGDLVIHLPEEEEESANEKPTKDKDQIETSTESVSSSPPVKTPIVSNHINEVDEKKMKEILPKNSESKDFDMACSVADIVNDEREDVSQDKNLAVDANNKNSPQNMPKTKAVHPKNNTKPLSSDLPSESGVDYKEMGFSKSDIVLSSVQADDVASCLVDKSLDKDANLMFDTQEDLEGDDMGVISQDEVNRLLGFCDDDSDSFGGLPGLVPLTAQDSDTPSQTKLESHVGTLWKPIKTHHDTDNTLVAPCYPHLGSKLVDEVKTTGYQGDTVKDTEEKSLTKNPLSNKFLMPLPTQTTIVSQMKPKDSTAGVDTCTKIAGKDTPDKMGETDNNSNKKKTIHKDGPSSKKLPIIPNLKLKLDLGALAAVQKSKDSSLNKKNSSETKTKERSNNGTKSTKLDSGNSQFEQDLAFYMRTTSRKNRLSSDSAETGSQVNSPIAVAESSSGLFLNAVGGISSGTKTLNTTKEPVKNAKTEKNSSHRESCTINVDETDIKDGKEKSEFKFSTPHKRRTRSNNSMSDSSDVQIVEEPLSRSAKLKDHEMEKHNNVAESVRLSISLSKQDKTEKMVAIGKPCQHKSQSHSESPHQLVIGYKKSSNDTQKSTAESKEKETAKHTEQKPKKVESIFDNTDIFSKLQEPSAESQVSGVKPPKPSAPPMPVNELLNKTKTIDISKLKLKLNPLISKKNVSKPSSSSNLEALHCDRQPSAPSKANLSTNPHTDNASSLAKDSPTEKKNDPSTNHKPKTISHQKSVLHPTSTPSLTTTLASQKPKPSIGGIPSLNTAKLCNLLKNIHKKPATQHSDTTNQTRPKQLILDASISKKTEKFTQPKDKSTASDKQRSTKSEYHKQSKGSDKNPTSEKTRARSDSKTKPSTSAPRTEEKTVDADDKNERSFFDCLSNYQTEIWEEGSTTNTS